MKIAINHEQLVDAIVVSNAEGRIARWNPAAGRMFGFAREEVLGNTLDVIIPERLRGRHRDGYQETMASGQTRYGSEALRVPAVHKDGRALSIAFTVALLTAPDGGVSGIVAVIRDETVRFQEERALKKRVAELEAQS